MTHSDERPDIILDLERLKTNCHGNSNIVEELVNHLLQKSAPQWISSLEEGLQAGDAKHLQQVCHAMKGSAATVFAWRISNIALTLERLADVEDIETFREGMPMLKRSFIELEQWKADNL